MLGGQSVDVENDGKEISREMLDYIYEHKTSALIEASMMAGAVLGGADEEQTALIEKAASAIGMAFSDPGRYPGCHKYQPGTGKTGSQ